MPSNSSERSQTGSWTLKVTDLVASVLAALSVERNSTRCVPLAGDRQRVLERAVAALLFNVVQLPACRWW